MVFWRHFNYINNLVNPNKTKDYQVIGAVLSQNHFFSKMRDRPNVFLKYFLSTFNFHWLYETSRPTSACLMSRHYFYGLVSNALYLLFLNISRFTFTKLHPYFWNTVTILNNTVKNHAIPPTLSSTRKQQRFLALYTSSIIIRCNVATKVFTSLVMR